MMWNFSKTICEFPSRIQKYPINDTARRVRGKIRCWTRNGMMLHTRRQTPVCVLCVWDDENGNLPVRVVYWVRNQSVTISIVYVIPNRLLLFAKRIHIATWLLNILRFDVVNPYRYTVQRWYRLHFLFHLLRVFFLSLQVISLIMSLYLTDSYWF